MTNDTIVNFKSFEIEDMCETRIGLWKIFADKSYRCIPSSY